MNTPTCSRIAVISAITILLFATIFSGISTAEQKTAYVAEDFSSHSTSGCTNATNPTRNNNDYSIYFEDGGWGSFDFSPFIGTSIEFYMRFGIGGGSAHDFSVTIKGKEVHNEVTVQFWIYSEDVDVRAIDSFNGDVATTDTERVSEKAFGQWAKVTITIRYTEDDLDGTTKELTVMINSVEALSQIKLFSGELSEEIKEREWKTVTINHNGEGHGDQFYLSDVLVATSRYSETAGFNFTYLIGIPLILGMGYLLISYFKQKKLKLT